ncbi:hypothetical protein E1B28_004324 [Marasmius oreades]|uniref:PUB domain-containing protein n=1 Tax=Marasmius oreades TaxID=181124 RepID=A0A9P7UYE8_9AGAR|nr:uncharacterized protein E1B28_004324 [Marasmius oreades]KAG7096922.1 hypothetical protein E1B28_004324 [Marasmius oreades]
MEQEHSTPINLAAAAERRQLEALQSQTRSLAAERAEHDKKQAIRRLVDPGIIRPNPTSQALESLRTIHRLCQNVLDDPENDKYHRIKTTNPKIAKDIVSPKGTVELLRELGFRPQVEDFQPYYRFNPARMTDLQIGFKIIGEALQIHTEKEERVASARQAEKEAKVQAAEKVRLAFMDDRRAKSELDERERELREARAAAAAQGAERDKLRQERRRQSAEESSEAVHSMPGSGHALGGSPPPYTDEDEDDN